jgi:hypothetical protein
MRIVELSARCLRLELGSVAEQSLINANVLKLTKLMLELAEQRKEA